MEPAGGATVRGRQTGRGLLLLITEGCGSRLRTSGAIIERFLSSTCESHSLHLRSPPSPLRADNVIIKGARRHTHQHRLRQTASSPHPPLHAPVSSLLTCVFFPVRVWRGASPVPAPGTSWPYRHWRWKLFLRPGIKFLCKTKWDKPPFLSSAQ